MRKVLITGVSNGIGAGLFEEMSKKYNVIGITREKRQVHQNLKNIIPCDLSDTKSVNNLDLSKYLAIDDEIIFINNAATIEPIKRNGDILDEELKNHFNINLLSPILLVQKLLPIAGNKRFLIINITSGASSKPMAGWSLYCSSKASMKMYLDCLEIEYPNIALAHYDPGVVDTKMQKIIRNTPRNDFPLVQKFTSYKHENKLKSISQVVNEVLEYL
jgi:benzil reductase ((S)-benzoin forming)